MQVGCSILPAAFLRAVTKNGAKYMQYFSHNSDANGSNSNSPLLNVSGFPFS